MVHSINRFRDEFAIDSNFVMTQLGSSNFPDSSQTLFFVHVRETGVYQAKFTIYRSKSQDGDLNTVN